MSHTYVLCAYHSHTRCKLVHYVRRIYFPPLYAFYGISYNFGYGKLAHNIHAHKFFNAMHESYSLLPFLGETCQHLYALHTHTHTLCVYHTCCMSSRLAQHFYNVKIVIALSTQLVRFLRGTSLSEVVFASKSSFYPAIH